MLAFSFPNNPGWDAANPNHKGCNDLSRLPLCFLSMCNGKWYQDQSQTGDHEHDADNIQVPTGHLDKLATSQHFDWALVIVIGAILLRPSVDDVE